MNRSRIVNVLKSMPQDVNLDGLFRRLKVLEQIEQGELSLLAENAIPHEVVKRRFGLSFNAEDKFEGDASEMH